MGYSAASAGNLAQAVAYAAKRINIPCQIFVPDSAPAVKKSMVLKLGAKLIELPFKDVWGMVRGDYPVPGRAVFIHPAFNKSLLIGYSSIAYEIIKDAPDLDAIVIPFGVGGLSLGVGKAIKQLKPDLAIYACEPETAAPLKKSLLSSQASSIVRTPSFVDAIGTPEVLPRVYQELAPILCDSLVVSLAEISQAMRILFLRQKLVCEGAAACGFAASQRLAKEKKHKKIVCVLTGGNVQDNILIQCLNEG